MARAGLVLMLAAALVAGCGGESGRTEPLVEDEEDGPQHVHGLGIDPADQSLYIATHTGLWRARAGEQRARRVGDSHRDVMGFTVVGPNRFLGSGHPDAREDLPPLLGLTASDDAGRSWRSVSLLGKADFHVLEASGQHVYGVNSADGRLMTSADRGRSWDAQTPPAAVFGLAVDPRDPRRIVTSTEQGLFASRDAGRRWRPLREDLGGLLAWPRADALYLLGDDGGVQVARHSGREWRPTGNIEGQPAAFMARGDELYAALHDGTVKVSSDAGNTWSVRAAP